MSADKHFDEFLRSKLSGYEDGFIGGDWQQFRQKLDKRKAEKKRRRRPVFVAFSTLSLIAIMAVIYSLSQQNSFLPGSHNTILYSEHSGPENRETKSDINKSYSAAENNEQAPEKQPGQQPSSSTLAGTNSPDRNEQGLADNGQRSGRPENNGHTADNTGTSAGTSGVHQPVPHLTSVSVSSQINLQHRHQSVHQNHILSTTASETNITQSASLNALKTATVMERANAGVMLAEKKTAKQNLKLTPLPESSQSNGKRPLVKPKVKLPLEIGLQTVVGTNYMNATASSGNGGAVHQDYAKFEKQSRKPGLTLGMNIVFKVPMGTHFSFNSGIGINQWKVENHYDFVEDSFPVINNVTHRIDGYFELRDPYKINVHTHTTKQFTEVILPVNTEYVFSLGNQMMLGLKAGGILHLNQSFSGTGIDPTYLTEKDLSNGFDLKKAYISWNFGTAMYMPLGSKMRLCIQPEFSHSIGSVLEPGDMVSWRYSSLKLTATALYRF